MKKEKKDLIIPAEPVTLRLAPDIIEKLDTLAAKKGISRSELIREFVNKGLSIESYNSEIDFLRKQIREEIKSIIEPMMNRLIKLNVKTGMVGAASYFLNAKALNKFVPDDLKEDYEEELNKSKKLGREYMRLNSEDEQRFFESGS